MTKTLLTALIAGCALLAGPAFAADTPAASPGCEAKAVDKNGKPLAGAAKTASIKKCEREAGATAAAADCEGKAVDKNGKALAGAAKTAFIKKCSGAAAAKP